MADRISELGDDLLVRILSCLTMRDAVATSFISQRWKDLWMYSTGNFHFDFGSAAINSIKQFRITNFLEADITRLSAFLEAERMQYIYRVHKFMRLHKGPTITAFMIKFDLGRESAKYIDNWMNFAMTKRVSTLRLDLARIDCQKKLANLYAHRLKTNSLCTFPSLESLDYQKPNLSRLTNLNLDTVHISRETVEYILSNSPALEYLRISLSPGLYGVRVVSTCPKLKHLEIVHCLSLEFLEIYSAPSLASFSYSGPKNTRLCLKDVPNLVEVLLQSEYCKKIIQKFHALHLPLSQIQNLKLLMCGVIFPCFNEFPKLQSVTQLELEFGMCGDTSSLLSCTHAIQACPNLCRLSVKFIWLNGPKPRVVANAEKEKGISYKQLKVVEFGGFRGTATDVELVTHILTRSPLLKKINVDTIKLDVAYQRPCIDYGEHMNSHAQKLALLLASKFSPIAQFHVR